MVLQRAIYTGFQRRRVRQISNPNGPSAHFIFISRPNAAPCRADFGAFAGRLFAHPVKLAVDR